MEEEIGLISISLIDELNVSSTQRDREKMEQTQSK